MPIILRTLAMGVLTLSSGCAFALTLAATPFSMCFAHQQQSLSSTANSDDGATVIVGAGVIGLSTAYHMALSSHRLAIHKSIVVIDILDEVFGATSSVNSGCLIPTELSGQLQELGLYSYGQYLELARDPGFLNSTGFRQQSLFNLQYGSGKGLQELPSWIKSQLDWDAGLDPPSGASASMYAPTFVSGPEADFCSTPKALGQWLWRQCLQLGVDIRISTNIQAVQLSSDDSLEAVTFKTPKDSIEILPARHLILAAGPWTANVFSKLFPGSAIDLGFSPVAGDYLILQNPTALTEESLSGVFLDQIVGHKLEFVGRNDKTIWVCAQTNSTATLPEPGSFGKPDPNMISELNNLSSRFVVPDLQVVDQGRSFRPSTRSGLPIIAAVPRTDLTDSMRPPQSDDKQSGIFICSGHGSYGVVLGMGTGKVMSQIVLGQKPDIDVSRFNLP